MNADIIGAMFFIAVSFLGIIGILSSMIFAVLWDGPFYLTDAERDERHKILRLTWKRITRDRQYIMARQDESIALLEQQIAALDIEFDKLRH